MAGKGGLAVLLGAKPARDSDLSGAGVGAMDETPGEEDASHTAGVDAMQALMDALDAKDPAGAFEALKDAIAAANG